MDLLRKSVCVLFAITAIACNSTAPSGPSPMLPSIGAGEAIGLVVERYSTNAVPKATIYITDGADKGRWTTADERGQTATSAPT